MILTGNICKVHWYRGDDEFELKTCQDSIGIVDQKGNKTLFFVYFCICVFAFVFLFVMQLIICSIEQEVALLVQVARGELNLPTCLYHTEHILPCFPTPSHHIALRNIYPVHNSTICSCRTQ